MIIKLKRLGFLLVLGVSNIIILGMTMNMFIDVSAQEPEEFLDWSIEVSKETFYPGEPVLLTLKVKNIGQQEEKIEFGAGGIEAFSMEIHDRSNKTVRNGGKIERFGFSTGGPLALPPGKIGQKSIVLNQWCSTLLPLGQYHVICHVEYGLRSEDTRIPGTEKGYASGPLHKISLKLDIPIVEMNDTKFKKILEELTKQAFETKMKTKQEFADQEIAREMLAFAESDLAVPYQLQILKVAPSTWLKWDAVNSLVRSETLEAAKGLVEIIEDPSVYKEDVKREVIEAIYTLRETGNPEIINATEDFVAKNIK